MNFVPPFGYNNTPYDGYNQGCGCNTPTYDNCNQVVQTCNVEEVPHYINYHTHVVNNCVKRHVNVPTYSQSFENRIINEYGYAPVMPLMGNTGMPVYNGNQTPTYTNTNMNNTCGCGNNTTFQPPQPTTQGLNNFFVPFPYGRE